jgi:hypothetical protein
MFIAAPQSSDWQHSAPLGMDGVIYDIFIKKHQDQFSAAWVCQECCEQSTWRAIAPTREAAIERATIGAEVHHSFSHKEKIGNALFSMSSRETLNLEEFGVVVIRPQSRASGYLKSIC